MTLRDARGIGKKLYLIDADAGPSLVRDIGELPPVPPDGGFDVRFASGHETEILRETASA